MDDWTNNNAARQYLAVGVLAAVAVAVAVAYALSGCASTPWYGYFL